MEGPLMYNLLDPVIVMTQLPNNNLTTARAWKTKIVLQPENSAL